MWRLTFLAFPLRVSVRSRLWTGVICIEDVCPPLLTGWSKLWDRIPFFLSPVLHLRLRDVNPRSEIRVRVSLCCALQVSDRLAILKMSAETNRGGQVQILTFLKARWVRRIYVEVELNKLTFWVRVFCGHYVPLFSTTSTKRATTGERGYSVDGGFGMFWRFCCLSLPTVTLRTFWDSRLRLYFLTSKKEIRCIQARTYRTSWAQRNDGRVWKWYVLATAS